MPADPTIQKKKKRGKPLGRALSWNFVVVSFIPVLLITCLVLYQITSDKIEALAEKNLLIARAVGGQVEVFLREPVTVLQNIRNMLTHNPALSYAEIRSILQNHVVHSFLLESIYVLDHDGKVMTL